MITGTQIIGASLIALLVDRFVLERRLGSTSFSRPATKLSQALGTGLPVLAVLTLSAALSCALVKYLLLPTGAAYLYPVVFAAFVAAAALAGELLLSKWQSPDMRNRIFGRSAVIAGILGFLVLVPQSDPAVFGTVSCIESTLDAILTGMVFFFIVLIRNGVREKIDLADETGRGMSLAQELVAAGLIALVLLGVSGLTFLHLIRVP